MDYLNNWDKQIPRLDVVDDFRNERAQIVRAQGTQFRFSYGDYIYILLLFSLKPYIKYIDHR